MDLDEIDQLIEDCENRESRLTDWERGFIDNVRLRWDAQRHLSEPTIAKLAEVWDRVTANG